MVRSRRAPSTSSVERPDAERASSPAPVPTPALEHAAAVYGYLRRRVLDGPTAEGLTHETYARAGLRPGARPASRSTLMRAAATLLRERMDGAAEAADGFDGPAVALFARALDPGLQAAFRALAPARQRILTLRFLDQLTPAEAAAVLDLRPSAFQARLAAAMRALDAASTTASGGAPAIGAVDAA